MTGSPPGMVPYLGYEDANRAIAFLTSAFGFDESVVYRDDGGAVVHAELTFNGGVVMIGTGADTQRVDTRDHPPAGRGVYCVVEDVEALFARAEAAGARVVWAPHDTEFGTRRCRVMDPEGYEWSFGTYAPKTTP